MKKTILIIFINIILILNVLIVFDWIFSATDTYARVCSSMMPTDGVFNDRHDIPLDFDSSKKSIVTMGCSFMYGTDIAQNETLPYKLQELTKRKVHNFSQPGDGIQHILYNIRHLEFFQTQKVHPDPEYIIYLFISDHLRRMYAKYFFLSSYDKYFTMKYKNGKFIPIEMKLSPMDYIYATHLSKHIGNYLFNIKSDKEKFDVFKLYVEECNRELKKQYPDSQFVVIVYNPDMDLHGFPSFRTNRWDELEKEGIKVINFGTPEYNFLTEQEYIAADKVHPSAKAWEVLTPIIIKELDL